MAFMLSMADVEKARSIAERYYLSYFASCPLVFGHRCWTLRCNYLSETDYLPDRGCLHQGGELRPTLFLCYLM